MPEETAEELSESTTDRAGRPFWSGTITFGLVSIPVGLYPASRPSRVSFRMLGPEGTPLQRRYYSEESGKDLDAEDIVRGYEIERGKQVIITDEELERLEPKKSRDIDLRRFVKTEDIPRMYFERSYFLAPMGPSSRAYRLLAKTMADTGLTGVATFVMRGKEHLVAIVAENGILRAETLRFADEVRSPKDIGLPARKRVPPRAVKAFERLIAHEATKKVPLSEMRNQESDRLLKLIKRKRGQARIQASEGKPAPKVVDIMEALKRSLAGKETQAGRRKAG